MDNSELMDYVEHSVDEFSNYANPVYKDLKKSYEKIMNDRNEIDMAIKKILTKKQYRKMRKEIKRTLKATSRR